MRQLLVNKGVWLVTMCLIFPMNFLFTFAWNHSLTELWPVVPNIGYWQGYLLQTVFLYLLPIRVIASMKED